MAGLFLSSSPKVILLSAEDFGVCRPRLRTCVWGYRYGASPFLCQAQRVHRHICRPHRAKKVGQVAEDSVHDFFQCGQGNAANAKELFFSADVDGGSSVAPLSVEHSPQRFNQRLLLRAGFFAGAAGWLTPFLTMPRLSESPMPEVQLMLRSSSRVLYRN